MLPVSIVIPTYNRSEKIRKTIDALHNQDYPHFELVVVDDGSTDGSTDRIEAMFRTMKNPPRLIRQKNGGASSAINHGVRESKNPLIILFDDDIIPAADTVRKHVEFHTGTPGSVLSGSADTDPDNVTTDVERYKVYMEELWLKARPDTLQRVKVEFSNFIITTANMSFSKNVFEQVGGFNVDLRDGYDVEFGFRVLLNKVPLYFDRALKSIHNDQISLGYYAGRQRAYNRSKQAIFKQYPELEKQFPRVAEKPAFPKSTIYSILRRQSLVRFFESRLFARLFPRSFRYRVYGSTIAALSLKP